MALANLVSGATLHPGQMAILYGICPRREKAAVCLYGGPIYRFMLSATLRSFNDQTNP
jgi:hypothetical protein